MCFDLAGRKNFHKTFIKLPHGHNLVSTPYFESVLYEVNAENFQCNIPTDCLFNEFQFYRLVDNP